MKNILPLLLLLLTVIGRSQSYDVGKSMIESHTFFELRKDDNKSLLVFLHGGVNNPVFADAQDEIDLDFLIEENQDFLSQAADNGFDIMAPITNDSLNWLSQPDESFSILQRLIRGLPKKYERIYIGGFSDGGSGSYKIFYAHPDYFDGLVVFNGYPQHSNYYRHVDYSKISDKIIVFYGTKDDQVMPYEFMLTEYCHQKKSNANTFLFVRSGDHSLAAYSKDDMVQLFDILTGEVKNEKVEPSPFHGLIKMDERIEFYSFRKKITRLYNYGKDTFLENKLQAKKWN